MKIVRAKYKNFNTSVPVFGSYTVYFENYTATVPDEVADYLIACDGSAFAIDRQILAEDIESVLVIRDMGLGDVLLVTPLLRQLRARGVKKITYAVNKIYVPLFEGNPNVDETVALENCPLAELKAAHDAVLDLRKFVEHRESSGVPMNRAVAFCLSADIHIGMEDARLDYFVRDHEVEEAKTVLPKSGPLCVLVWRASSSNRCLSEERNLAIIDAMAEEGINVAVTDQEHMNLGDREAGGKVINLTGKLSIRGVGAVMSLADVVVTPDTGAFHMASALDKPVVTYFGSFPLAERASHLKVVDEHVPMPCYPCRHYYCLARSADGTPKCLSVEPGKIARLALSSVRAKPASRKKAA